MSEVGLVTMRRRSKIVVDYNNILFTGQSYSDSNKVYISGMIVTELKFSHEVQNQKYYSAVISVKRYSDNYDLIPLIVSGDLIGEKILKESINGKYVEVLGQFKSYDQIGIDGNKHLILFVFANEIRFYDELSKLKIINGNYIYLDGYLCKKPIYRKTPLGSRITDLCIAVNRRYARCDYIPCIAWNNTAKWASYLEVGTHVQIYGRIQSRYYFKKYEEEKKEKRIAFEISIAAIYKVAD